QEVREAGVDLDGHPLAQPRAELDAPPLLMAKRVLDEHRDAAERAVGKRRLVKSLDAIGLGFDDGVERRIGGGASMGPRGRDVLRRHFLAGDELGQARRVPRCVLGKVHRVAGSSHAAEGDLKKSIKQSSTRSGASASIMWPQSESVTVRPCASAPASSPPRADGVMTSLAPLSTSAGPATRAAAAAPPRHARRAGRSAWSTPRRLGASKAKVPPPIHSPGTGLGPSFARLACPHAAIIW